MRVIAMALWTEPVLFLSAVAAVFTVGGSLAVVLGAPAWIALVCAVVGPAIAAAARAKAWAPASVHELTSSAQRAAAARASLVPPA